MLPELRGDWSFKSLKLSSVEEMKTLMELGLWREDSLEDFADDEIMGRDKMFLDPNMVPIYNR
jgi:hypothetical protein